MKKTSITSYLKGKVRSRSFTSIPQTIKSGQQTIKSIIDDHIEINKDETSNNNTQDGIHKKAARVSLKLSINSTDYTHIKPKIQSNSIGLSSLEDASIHSVRSLKNMVGTTDFNQFSSPISIYNTIPSNRSLASNHAARTDSIENSKIAISNRKSFGNSEISNRKPYPSPNKVSLNANSITDFNSNLIEQISNRIQDQSPSHTKIPIIPRDANVSDSRLKDSKSRLRDSSAKFRNESVTKGGSRVYSDAKGDNKNSYTKGKSVRNSDRKGDRKGERNSERNSEGISEGKKSISISSGTTLTNLALKIGITPKKLQAKLVDIGFERQRLDHLLNQEVVEMILLEYDMDSINKPIIEVKKSVKIPGLPRPPVVTIMGHVDHGKTTLLDTLRKSKVVESEFGGITQHIGAFKVHLKSSTITFLDTPGHAAFSTMRSRGAQVTDLVVLVVAIDDGIMPQTIESIKHCKASGVPMIIAVNKCDKANIDSTGIKAALMDHDVMIEEMGGDVPCCLISAKTGLDTIVALSEILDLRADYGGIVEAVVLESKITPKSGIVSTLIIRCGTLIVGDILVSGLTWCKVKRIVDDAGTSIASATPSQPVEVYGWREVPEAGDEVIQAESEAFAKLVVKSRQEHQLFIDSIKEIDAINSKRQISEQSHVKSYRSNSRKDYLNRRKNIQNLKKNNIDTKSVVEEETEYRLVLKCDVKGSAEAIEQVLNALPSHKIQCKVLSSTLGTITQSDLDFAKTTGSTIITFNTRTTNSIILNAKRMEVRIESHQIIYRLVDAVKASMSDQLPLLEEIRIEGEARVQALFTIKKDLVLGCRVLTGKLERTNIRVVRDGVSVYTGKVRSLKHHVKDIDVAAKGLECGVGIDFEGRVGDLVQNIVVSYVKQQIE